LVPHTYLIELGRETLLCAAECARLLKWQEPACRLEAIAPHVLLVESEPELQPDFWDMFGGVVRVARCIGKIEELTADGLLSLKDSASRFESGNRIVFGLSVFGDKNIPSKELLVSLLNQVKDRFRERGVSSRYLEPHGKETVLTSAQVGESRMLDTGFEWIAVKSRETWRIGSTCWIQDYSGQSARDYERPRADPRSGMLPPKLARIMVNLARGPQTRTLLDPFCGSGGILMEAMLLGLDPTALDRDLEAVKSARENCDWLQENAKRKLPVVRYTQGDATEMRHYFEPLSFDCVVTEPYLGPPLMREPSPARAKQVVRELSDLYREVLAEIRIVTRPGGGVVFVTPSFRDTENNEHAIPLGLTARLAGYRSSDPLGNIAYVERFGIPAEMVKQARSGMLRYSRQGQHVTRWIYTMES